MLCEEDGNVLSGSGSISGNGTLQVESLGLWVTRGVKWPPMEVTGHRCLHDSSPRPHKSRPSQGVRRKWEWDMQPKSICMASSKVWS